MHAICNENGVHWNPHKLARHPVALFKAASGIVQILQVLFFFFFKKKERMGYMGHVAQTRPNGSRLLFSHRAPYHPRFYDADRAPGPARKFPRPNPMMTGGGALSTSTPRGRRGAWDPHRRLTRGPALPRTGSLLIPPNWRVRPRGQTATATAAGAPVRSCPSARPRTAGVARGAWEGGIVWWPRLRTTGGGKRFAS